MYCPKCRTEYEKSFKRCLDCDVKLVKDLPPEQAPEIENLVTVFEGDSASASVVRATVEGAGIESWVKDEEVHGLFPSLGSTEVLVCEEDEKSALKALEMPEPHVSAHSSPKQPKSTPGPVNAQGKQNQASEKGHHVKDRRR